MLIKRSKIEVFNKFAQTKAFINNINMTSKLIALITTFSLFIIIIGLLAVSYISKINDNAENMYTNNMMANLYLAQLSEKNLELEKLEVEYVLGDYNMDSGAVKNEIANVMASLPEIYVKLEALLLAPYIVERLEAFKSGMSVTTKEFELVDERVSDQRKIEAYMYFQNRLSKERDELGTLIAEMKQHITEQANSANKSNMQSAKQAILWMAITVFVLMLVASMMFLHIYNHFRKPIIALSAEMEKVKHGELNITANYQFSNELGQLTKDFLVMTHGIKTMVGHMKKTAEKVEVSSSDMLEGTTQMREFSKNMTGEITTVAGQASIQVQHMNESVRAMEEVAGAIGRVNESAIDVAEQASEANEQANIGVNAMRRLHLQMNAVLDGSNATHEAIDQFMQSSTEIAKFVELIDEISRQVQLLALNASIEAARAGEYGKGFAVVATEVRELAEHTKDASKSIGKMVKVIQKQAKSAVTIVEKEKQAVKQGMDEVSTSEVVFNHITTAVHTINTQLQEVTAAMEEMSASAEEVTSSLQEVSHLSTESSKQATHVADLAKQQQYIMGDIQNLATDLDVIATDLRQESAKFKV